jgi:hypothetical protein
VTSRRLTPEEAAAVLARAEPLDAGRPAGRRVRSPLRGRAPDGDELEVGLDTKTVVLLLSTSCDGCRDLAELVAAGVDGAATVGVLRPATDALPDAVIDTFTGAGGCWLLGDDPFDALAVHATPFFCVVDAGSIVVEGVAFGRAHVEAHVVRALAGEPQPDAVWLPGSR